MKKQELRKTMKTKREELSRQTVLEHSSIIWNKIYNMPIFQSATTIFLYSSIDNEVDTVEVAIKALAMGKKIAYPATNTTNNTMEFHAVKDLSELSCVKFGAYSLLEPKLDPSTKVIPDSKTLMIVPALAFDKKFYRIGYGGGFYDKYLDQYPSLDTLGVCYDFQVVDRIRTDEYDQPVDQIVTEVEGAIR